MADTNETICDIIAEKRRMAELIRKNLSTVLVQQWRQQSAKSWEDEANRLEAAYTREITILRDALAEVVASIEVRFPVIEYALDRKPYLDAKKILEQYKEEAK